MVDFINQKVIHETFGKGNVVNYDDSYISINFKSGDKKFSFPEAFKEYVTFIDEKATSLVNKKIEKREKEREREELILEEERNLRDKLRYIANQKKRTNSDSVNSSVQSVFWCESEEEADGIFAEWQVFTGNIQSGKRKGEPRRLARMNQNSACLLTKRQDSMLEENRKILGLFMANESFDGRSCEDGYIIAHPEYRIHLSKEESEKMLFWNYYFDRNSPKDTVWRSGRHRYFDNIWMAQILRDIVILREGSEEEKEAQVFFEYFCEINHINKNALPKANGALIRIENK